PDNETGLCPCGTCSFDAITHVARAVADVPARRKAVVFIGGYIPMNASALEPVTSPDPLFVNRDCQPSIVTAMEEMLQATQRANLTVYSFDPNGLQPAALGRIPSADLARRFIRTPGQPSYGRRSPEALLALADNTGGRAFMNTNAPEMRVEDV